MDYVGVILVVNHSWRIYIILLVSRSLVSNIVENLSNQQKRNIKICPKCAKCDLWVKRCGRGDDRFEVIDHVNKDTYICSLHFEGESGPTTEYPDPVSCVNKKLSNKVKVTKTSLAEKYEQINDERNQGIENSNHSAKNIDCTTVHNVLIDERQNG
ncbi:PREDICTED: uncharacterized protein LOC107068131 [Polistes dominula]|uniref:Uncharacterized protein LOC107068131 n=1 Tax=Polistes dominula TaxID=743375 RepID=A0ABM1IHM8_POLDO|nr:PREDICTED: uncharacterized protein LOC107068131 [Polistes dominula]